MRGQRSKPRGPDGRRSSKRVRGGGPKETLPRVNPLPKQPGGGARVTRIAFLDLPPAGTFGQDNPPPRFRAGSTHWGEGFQVGDPYEFRRKARKKCLGNAL